MEVRIETAAGLPGRLQGVPGPQDSQRLSRLGSQETFGSHPVKVRPGSASGLAVAHRAGRAGPLPCNFLAAPVLIAVLRMRARVWMIKSLLVAVMGLTPLSVSAASAPTEKQCSQVRAAVAQYGYTAAKVYANAIMTPEGVRAASTCLNHKPTATRRDRMTRKHHVAR